MASCVVDENLPHELRRDSEEVSAVLPLWQGLLGESDVSFVDKSGALQGMTWALLAEVVPGNAAQLTVDQRQKQIERSFVSGAPPHQKLSNLIGRTALHASQPQPTFRKWDDGG